MILEKFYNLFKPEKKETKTFVKEIPLVDFELKFGELEGICQDFHGQDVQLKDIREYKESFHYLNPVEITNLGYIKDNHAFLETELEFPVGKENSLLTKRFDRFYRDHHAS